MKREQTPKGACADVRTPDGAESRPTDLSWVDPETGERLRVTVRSSEQFLTRLVAVGFQLHQGQTDAAFSGRAGGRSARSGSSEARAGSAHPGPRRDGTAA